MSVNDIIVQGADPLFFLDYYSCSKLYPKRAVDIIKGVSEGCKLSGCALIGGETAEMPGIYNKGILNSNIDDYDIAGFCVGVVERRNLLPKLKDIKIGDTLIGLPSSGVHSNGYSLVFKIMEKCNISYKEHNIKELNFNNETIGEILLKPTRIYVEQLRGLINKGLVKAMAHITGGGIVDNLPRILPSENNICAEIDVSSWPILPIFKFLKNKGNIEQTEMFRTFNNGIGMILIIDSDNLSCVRTYFEMLNEDFYQIGRIVERNRDYNKVVFKNAEMAFDY